MTPHRIDISKQKDELSRLFKNGSTYDQLVDHLSKTYQISISKSTIKAWFREWKVKKRNNRVFVYQQEGERGLVKIAEQEWMSDQEHHDIEMVPPSSCPLLSQDKLVDPDIFAILRPENENARFCIRMPANQTRYVGFDNIEAEIGSRDPTPAPGVLPCIDLDHLLLRFSDTETNQWTIGRDESCEIVFQGSGVSRRHCCIFAEDDGFYIKDISTYGTAVAYNGENPVLQKSGKWLIARKPGESTVWETLMLQVGNVAMSIVLPYHNSGDPTYLENFQKFTQAGESALPAMTRLGLVTYSSTIALGTPNHMQPVFYPKDELQVGKFFEVRIDENTIFILAEGSRLLVHMDSINKCLGYIYENWDPQAKPVKILAAEKRMLGCYLPLESVAKRVGAGKSDAKSVALKEKLQRVPREITRLQPVCFNRKPCKPCSKRHARCNRGSPCDMCANTGQKECTYTGDGEREEVQKQKERDRSS